MNTNVGDMPLEIFGDYVSDYLDIEFYWQYMFVFNEQGDNNGDSLGQGWGNGNGLENYGTGTTNIYGDAFGNGSSSYHHHNGNALGENVRIYNSSFRQRGCG